MLPIPGTTSPWSALGGPEPFGRALVPWLNSVEREFDNLRAVFSYLEARPERGEDLLRALVTLRRYWVLGTRRREGFDLLERALEVHERT